MTTLARERVPELMDAPEVDARQLRASLADLRRVNRWLGGRSAALTLLRPLIAPDGAGETRVLDVATGGADIPLALVGVARREGARVRVVATDFHPGTLAEARARTAGEPEVEVRAADALALPFEDRSFDVAMCHSALHHFDHADAVRALREMARVAMRAVVVTDLRRSRAALLGARVLAATAWRWHPVTRHDGPRSVQAAFTPGELRELAAAAGLHPVRVRTHPVFRLSLVVDLRPPG